MATENKSETTRPQKCHTELCEPGSNKSTMRKPRLPPAMQEPRDHRVSAARATCAQIHGYDPKASDDAFIWHVENRKRDSETNCENGSKVKRKRNYGRSGATQSPLTCALSIISLEVGSSSCQKSS